MKKMFWEVGWFVAVGCAAAATHWLAAVGCVTLLALPPLVANVLGWLVAFIVSFSGHYWLTFRHQQQALGVALRRFFLISASGFAVNECAYAWLLKATSVRYDLLLAAILVAIAFLTFVVSRLWAFRRTPAAS